MKRTVARFLRRPLNVLALALVAGLVLVALGAPVLAPVPPGSESRAFKVVGDAYDLIPHPPSAAAPLGTLTGQLDVYHTLVWGTRSALVFGLAVALAAAALGTLVGALGGYLGGWVNDALMRTTDALLSVPVLAGVWLFETILLPPGMLEARDIFGWNPSAFQLYAIDFQINPLMLGLILFTWMPYARLVNTNVRLLMDAEFVTAARSVGMGGPGILFRHLLPNAVAPSLVLLARDVGAAVVISAALTFVGMSGGSEWGTIITVSRAWILGQPGNPLAYWWVFVPATAMIVLFSTAWNLLGDGLNAALDPHTA